NALQPLGFAVTFLAHDPMAPAASSPPLNGVVAPEAIDQPVSSYLSSNGIHTAQDLTRLKLDDLATAPGVDRASLTRFVRALSRSERYPDAQALQDFLVRRGIFI
ncbi:MAG TPA: hypothetical protein VNQ74_04825, partial [Burkholderiaceae bacterium]|nr:hypothetical protein [Burkholderiaceae bacterium]